MARQRSVLVLLAEADAALTILARAIDGGRLPVEQKHIKESVDRALAAIKEAQEELMWIVRDMQTNLARF